MAPAGAAALVLALAAAGTLGAVYGDGFAAGSPHGEHPHETPASPAPPLGHSGALMLAARAGDVLVGVQANRGRLRVAVIPPDARRLPRSRVRVSLRAATGPARRVTRACGWNCLELRDADALRGRPATLLIRVARGSGSVHGSVALPALMPPSGRTLHARVGRVMARVRTVRVRQVLSSGASTLRSTWLYQAPDRSSYVASNGTRGVHVGGRHWEYADGRWTVHSGHHARSPRYMWAGASRPRILGRATRRGRRVQVLAVFRPNGSYPAFYKLYVERSGRVLEAEMLAPAHFMVDRLDRFNASIRISPPA